MAKLSRLIALLCVLLMPLGMQPAAAMPVQHHAAMPMRHCPEQRPNHHSKGDFAECTMACSAALPASDLSRSEPCSIAGAQTEPALAQALRGLHPETATPPPRRS